jgi:O-methyltransferase
MKRIYSVLKKVFKRCFNHRKFFHIWKSMLVNSSIFQTINTTGYRAFNYVVSEDIQALEDRVTFPDHLIPSLMDDYPRILSLELITREIYTNDVRGSVAEVGVYRGDFAFFINFFFQDRRFYLFDTFAGFDKRDLEPDAYQLNQDFSTTSADLVLQKMPRKELCIVKKGYFPESLDGLEDSFCFVSLDADLYQPTLRGLEYFYPRLNRGGYMCIHDYNNGPYPGVKTAVLEFCNKNRIHFVPLPDQGGTIVICKQ